MPSKYKTVFTYSFGIGRDFLVKESNEDGKKIYYFVVDEKFADEKYKTKRLKPAFAKEFFINNTPKEWSEVNKKREHLQYQKSEILSRYFN